jgi:hypothetical protein
VCVCARTPMHACICEECQHFSKEFCATGMWKKCVDNKQEVLEKYSELCKGGTHDVQGGSNMTGTNCDLFTHKSSRSCLNHLVDQFN